MPHLSGTSSLALPQGEAQYAQDYIKDLKLLERTVGKRLIRNVTVLDVQHWYDEWRKPETENGPERIDPRA